jgi:Ala-tRNA(Pro) deacylase
MGIRDYLRGRAVRFEVLLHRPAASATRMAETMHVSGRVVAKGVLVRAGEAYVLAVLPATHRIDLARLAALLGVDEVRIATEPEVMTIFHDCERGALPPFGRLYGLSTIVDVALADGSEIVFVANARHEGVRMGFGDYETLESPMRGRFATMTCPGRRAAAQRKAG